MNAQRRAAIARVVKEVAALIGKLDDITTAIYSLQDEEQEALDNRPESFQETEAGEKQQSAIDALDTAAEACRDASSQLEDACSELENSRA